MSDSNNDKLHINLHIYDTDLPVNVIREEEYLYREAAKIINNTINTYAGLYKGRTGDKEILYMSLIDIALKYEKELQRNDTQPFEETLKTLTSEIERVLDFKRKNEEK